MLLNRLNRIANNLSEYAIIDNRQSTCNEMQAKNTTNECKHTNEKTAKEIVEETCGKIKFSVIDVYTLRMQLTVKFFPNGK